MDSPIAALKFLLLKTPFMLKTVLFHILSLSPTSSRWDLRTAVVVNIVREMLANSPPSTISKQQKRSLRDPGVKGKMWVSKVTLPAPSEDAVRDLLLGAIGACSWENAEYARPALLPVEAEWTGRRPGVADGAPEPSISEADKYDNLVKEVTTDVTLLYFHGGAYYLMDPCTQRPAMGKYSELTGGRVFSVRYRLAPQNPSCIHQQVRFTSRFPHLRLSLPEIPQAETSPSAFCKPSSISTAPLPLEMARPSSSMAKWSISHFPLDSH
jgi:hypothetical protein